MKKELSIIIVNFQSEKWLENCIAFVFEFFKNINFEIIVVNNDKKNVETHFNASNIKIINHGRNIGFGAGVNLGTKKATGKYLLFLNPDTEILPGDWRKLLEKFEHNPEVAVIGPRLLTEKNETQWWCAGRELTLWSILKNNFGIIESKKVWESKEETGADWVSGGAMFVRADAFSQTGGLDEQFFMYYEDEDLCRRIRDKGYKVLYLPDFVVKHFCGKSWDGMEIQKKEFRKSQDYYFDKHCGKFQVSALRILRKIFDKK